MLAGPLYDNGNGDDADDHILSKDEQFVFNAFLDSIIEPDHSPELLPATLHNQYSNALQQAASPYNASHMILNQPHYMQSHPSASSSIQPNTTVMVAIPQQQQQALSSRTSDSMVQNQFRMPHLLIPASPPRGVIITKIEPQNIISNYFGYPYTRQQLPVPPSTTSPSYTAVTPSPVPGFINNSYNGTRNNISLKSSSMMPPVDARKNSVPQNCEVGREPAPLSISNVPFASVAVQPDTNNDARRRISLKRKASEKVGAVIKKIALQEAETSGEDDEIKEVNNIDGEDSEPLESIATSSSSGRSSSHDVVAHSNKTLMESDRSSPFAIPVTEARSTRRKNVHKKVACLPTPTPIDKQDEAETDSSSGRAKYRGSKPLLTEEEKRTNHIESEKKRRQNIRSGFDALTHLVPSLQTSHRLSEAEILQQTIGYVKTLLDTKGELKARASKLRIVLRDSPVEVDPEDSSDDEASNAPRRGRPHATESTGDDEV
ncbi:hypothetical protein SeMB42_g03597 [Synchytrium endobioticum]|uniref:BHLH domain-containing protein n=1 Tax=Synchytrium endobioticum TaxID=286115 RepID=A0A507D754_9FUNG|nr:hypothetical protein SeMB42_g03597 [Synchytrium endobioticum]